MRDTVNFQIEEEHLIISMTIHTMQNHLDYEKIKNHLIENGFEIVFSKNGYSPLLLRILGFVLEPISRIRNLVIIGTWEYYKFESIIWARKLGYKYDFISLKLSQFLSCRVAKNEF